MNEAWIAVHAEHNAARLSVKSVGARRGVGVSQLFFRVEVATRKEIGEGKPLWIGGELGAKNLGPTGSYLGALRTQIQPITLPERGGTKDVEFVTDLSDTQLQVIEDHRTSSVVFDLDFAGHWLIDGSPIPFWSAHIEYEIKQSDWIAILEQTGYRRLLLVELDLPDTQQSGNRALALRYFAEARRHYLEHDWRHTVESLRQALAAIVGKEAEDEYTEEDVRASIRELRRAAGTRNVGYMERYEPVRTALKFLCDLGGHPEAGEASKTDAYAALLMVAGLLHGLPAPSGVA